MRILITTIALRGGCYIAALLLSGGIAFPQPSVSAANLNMAGCRNFIQSQMPPSNYRSDFEMGECLGVARGVSYADPEICRPASATHEQMIRVVVQYIDSRPARMHENFMKLVAEALRAAWPCKP